MRREDPHDHESQRGRESGEPSPAAAQTLLGRDGGEEPADPEDGPRDQYHDSERRHGVKLRPVLPAVIGPHADFVLHPLVEGWSTSYLGLFRDLLEGAILWAANKGTSEMRTRKHLIAIDGAGRGNRGPDSRHRARQAAHAVVLGNGKAVPHSRAGGRPPRQTIWSGSCPRRADHADPLAALGQRPRLPAGA